MSTQDYQITSINLHEEDIAILQQMQQEGNKNRSACIRVAIRRMRRLEMLREAYMKHQITALEFVDEALVI
jgi:Arc/MetJ-type ribon-helix-helix transcriptional regulator